MPRAQDPVERRACAIVRLSRSCAAPTASISASTAGSAVPGRFASPAALAAREWKMPVDARRASASRANDSAIEIRSKSKSACRAWYCAESTMPDRGIDADRPHVLDPRRNDADEAFVLDQDIRPSAVSPLSLTRTLPSRFQPASASSFDACAEQLAVAAGAVGDRLHHRLAEGLRRQLVAQRLEQRQFLAATAALRPCSRSVSKQELRALVGAVEQVALGPFEVEAQRDRPPHARVAEALAALVDRRSPAWTAASRPGNSRLTTLPAASAGKS